MQDNGAQKTNQSGRATSWTRPLCTQGRRRRRRDFSIPGVMTLGLPHWTAPTELVNAAVGTPADLLNQKTDLLNRELDLLNGESRLLNRSPQLLKRFSQ